MIAKNVYVPIIIGCLAGGLIGCIIVINMSSSNIPVEKPPTKTKQEIHDERLQTKEEHKIIIEEVEEISMLKTLNNFAKKEDQKVSIFCTHTINYYCNASLEYKNEHITVKYSVDAENLKDALDKLNKYIRKNF